MTILNQLASSLNRKDEEPNIDLARLIVKAKNKTAIKELVENLSHPQKDIQQDCIKVLYEVGALNPGLISGYLPVFTHLLRSRNNRMQWGAMTALQSLTTSFPSEIYAVLPEIITRAQEGSVITKDNAFKILVGLCSLKPYAKQCFPLLNEMLLSSPTNQLPMYAELAIPVINPDNRTLFIKTLKIRFPEIEKESKQKRVEKVIRKVS